jgi:hypothetical protein
MTLKSFTDSNSTEARQFLLDRRGERPHPKRHRTLGRRKRLAKAKRERIKQRNALIAKERSAYLAAVKLYWTGLGNHP